MRALIVNGDDFGFTNDVNEGIVAAHRQGILTATTLMANGAAFEEAVRLARETPSLDVGCHLVLVGGRSLLPPFAPLPRGIPQLLRGLVSREIVPYAEMRAQIERIVAADIQPTHLDTHKHTHLAPPVLEAVAKLSREFGVPWVRRPFDIPLTRAPAPLAARAVGRSLEVLRKRFHRVLERHGCRSTDHFAGFLHTGRFCTRSLVELIAKLPDGLTEFMCHPGYCGPELQQACTRLKHSRESELQALVAPEVRDALAEAGITLARYRDL